MNEDTVRVRGEIQCERTERMRNNRKRKRMTERLRENRKKMTKKA